MLRDKRIRLLPALWLTTAILVFAPALAGWIPLALAQETSLHDSYYVVAHPGPMLGLAALCLVFAVIYFGFDHAGRTYPRGLSRGHLAATIMGLLMTQGPWLALTFSGSGADPVATLSRWSAVASLGYGLMLVGQCLFLALAVRVVKARASRRA